MALERCFAESMVVALYTTLHWRCSPQHNSYLVLPFIRIRHPFISVHFQSFYITRTFSTKRQVCIYRKIRPSKHQITKLSPKLLLSALSIFNKEEKKKKRKVCNILHFLS